MSNLHGILLVKKPSGVTSHDVVNTIRKSLKTKAVGHAGTLDPLAEGLMVLLLGEATKISNYVLEENKQYEVTLLTGIETDTLDITGTVINRHSGPINNAKLIEKAVALKGDFIWEVPLYSATKVAGRKLYEQARSGENPSQLPRKPMSFWDIEPLGQTENQQFRFRLNCSKGSFIRSWVQHLGKGLGCGAVMTGLTRTYSAPYALNQAVLLGDVTTDTICQLDAFIPLKKALPQFKVLRVNGHSEGLIRNGQISHELRRRLICMFDPEKDVGVKIFSSKPEELLALVGLEIDKGFVVKRVFRY